MRWYDITVSFHPFGLSYEWYKYWDDGMKTREVGHQATLGM